MKITHEQELAELRIEFAKVDLSDPASILEWFAKHSHLTVAEHAMVAQRSDWWLRQLRRKVFLSKQPPKVICKSAARRVIHNINVPTDWNNKEWLTTTLAKHGIKNTAKAIGIHFSKLYECMEALGIPKSGRKANNSTNLCCTRQWVYEHYVTQGLSQAQCAQLAGIARQAFRNWLIKFKIPVRKSGRRVTKVVAHPTWVSKLIQELEKLDLVRWVETNPTHLHVYFENYMWESYFIDETNWVGNRRRRHSFRIFRHDSVITKIPAVVPEFESSLDGTTEYAAHVHLPHREMKAATFMEKRLAIHHLLRVVGRRGWLWPYYPERVITNELQLMRESRLTQFYRDGRYTAYPNRGQKPTLGQRIITHFFGLEELAPFFRSPRKMIGVLDTMFKDGDKFTLDMMIRHAATVSKLQKVFDPGVYQWLFHQLGAKGTVLDLHPGHGHKALACALAGLRYTTIPTQRFQKAIDNGFAEFIGLQYEPYSGQKIDWVLSDDNFKGTDISEGLQYGSASHLLHFVPRAQHAIHMRYKPSQVIPIITKWHNKLPNYLFLF